MPIVAVALFALLGFFTPLRQATPTPETGEIPPVLWELTAMTPAGGEETAIADPTRYNVQFLPDDKLAAKLDCNRGAGGYTIEDGVLTIGQMATTMALCEPDSQANDYQLILQAVTAYEFDADGNLILSGDDGSLRFRPTLTAVVWEWQEFVGGDGAVVTPDDPAHYAITFLDEGKVAIQADCNRAFGSWSADDARIDITVGGVTKMACPEGSQMDRFLRDLDDAGSHVFRDGHLFLALPIDSGILEFAPRFVAPEKATPATG